MLITEPVNTQYDKKSIVDMKLNQKHDGRYHTKPALYF